MKAFASLQEFKATTAELRATEEAMKFGLEIFDIEPASYPEVARVEDEIAQLTEIWEIKNDWDKQWEVFKELKFYDLEMEKMDNDAEDFQDKVKGLVRMPTSGGHTSEVRDWGVFNHLKTEIDKFRATMPLLVELRADAMRERHWKELRFEVKDDFDEQGDEFNLEKVFSLNLLMHQEKVNELADNAKKQLKIETGLENIRRTWEDDPATDLVIEQKKSKAD